MAGTFLFACLLQIFASHVFAHREHKVHNIVLYPEKHSWCKTTPIKQVVGHPDCGQLEMDNNVCVGACFSYSIPRTEPTAPGEVAPYCDSCQPSTVTWKHITLNCGEDKEPMMKRVEFIENCSCLTCRHVEPEVSPTVHEVTTVDVPQLLNMMSQPKGNGSSQQPPGAVPHNKHNYKLSQLLKLLSGSEDLVGLNSAEDKLHVLITELKERGGLEDELQGLADEAEELGQDGQVKVDISKLKELLLSKLGGEHDLSEELGESVHRHHQHHSHKHDGPHHSKLIGDSEEVLPNPTLDVAPHHLRPAVEGSEITYVPQHHHHTHNSDRD